MKSNAVMLAFGEEFKFLVLSFALCGARKFDVRYRIQFNTQYQSTGGSENRVYRVLL